MECIETFCHIMVYVVKTFVTTWNSTIIIPKSGSEITKVTKEFSPKAAYSRTLRMCNRMVPAFFPRRNVRFYCFDSRNEVWEWYMTHWPVSFSFVFWGAIFSRQISKGRTTYVSIPIHIALHVEKFFLWNCQSLLVEIWNKIGMFLSEECRTILMKICCQCLGLQCISGHFWKVQFGLFLID